MAGTSGNTPTDPTGRDFGESSAVTWGRFELRLAAYLSTMVDPDAGDHLVLEVPGDSGSTGCAPYLQFAAFGDGAMIRAEVSSNRFLAPGHHLSPQQMRELETLGWCGADAEHPNHYLERSVTEVALVSATTVVVLRDLFHLPYPELLSVQAWGPAATEIAILGLPDTADVPADIVDAPAETGDVPTGAVDAASAPQVLEVLYTDDRAQLLGCVRDALRERCGVEPTIDEDEDFVLIHLNQPVWIRVGKDDPVVVILARVVHSVRSRRQAAVELGILNRDHPWAKWTLRERSVWQTLLISGQPFAPEHLGDALDAFFASMTETRDDLALRTGGTAG